MSSVRWRGLSVVAMVVVLSRCCDGSVDGLGDDGVRESESEIKWETHVKRRLDKIKCGDDAGAGGECA
jgi:hypothetical protein